MKLLKISLTIAAFMISVLSGLSQKGVEDGSRWGKGEDSIRCIRNYSLYREYYKQKIYKDAFPYWRIVYAECPKASRTIYQHGANMYKFYIIEAQNKNKIDHKNSLVDTLLQVYDQRVKWYPTDRAKVLGFKAQDILRFKKNDLTFTQKAYDFSSESINAFKYKAPKSVIFSYMTITLDLFGNNALSEQEVVENYAKTIDILDKQLEKNPDDEELDDLKESIMANFANSGAASCESLIQLFTPQFKENPDDVDILKKISYWLNSTGCTESELYLNATIALNKIEPSANLAYHIAQLYNKQSKYQAAIKYYKQAVNQETDRPLKSKYLVELGYIIQSEYNDLPQAKQYAQQAIQANPNSGRPYMLLGNIYAGAKNFGEDDLAHTAVYWIAVDQFKTARQKESELARIANEKIRTYSKYFPDTETVFFFGYKVGDTYKLGGWINESTKVRTR